jgi:hypothetical protein
LRTARQAVSGLVDALGASHPYTLAAKSVTGALLAEAGDLTQAEELESLVADSLTKALGRNHPDTLRSLANLLITREQLGIPDVASTAGERERVVADLGRVIGPDHSHVRELSSGRRLMNMVNPQPF